MVVLACVILKIIWSAGIGKQVVLCDGNNVLSQLQFLDVLLFVTISVLMGLMIDAYERMTFAHCTHQLTGTGKMRTERKSACGLQRYWLRNV